MKLYYEGEKGRAVCGKDGLSPMTFARADVPFSDGKGLARDILVGICDRCGEVVAIPPQSTPAIKAARERATASIEANLPAIYLDALDLACYRIDPNATQDFRKRLLMYYVVYMSDNKKRAAMVGSNLTKLDEAFRASETTSKSRRRLSMKVTPSLNSRLERLMMASKLNRTELFKSLVVQIDKDIVKPAKPANLDKLQALAAIAIG
jgi:hypothetical protein